MQKFCHKKVPIIFSEYFCETDTMHRSRTRQNLAGKFAILRYNTSRLQRSINYGGIGSRTLFRLKLDIVPRPGPRIT